VGRSTRMYGYIVVTICFWVGAFGPGGGGTGDVTLHWEAAVINGLLLVPLWHGARWAALLLSVLALMLIGGISWGGVYPWGTAFGLLSVVAAVQFGLVHPLSYPILGPVLASSEEVAESG
jgi:hypothetical protein